MLVAGCGQGPQAEFSLRATTEDLLPDAQKAAKKALKDAFGTPNELVAWKRFPVNYGGVNGTVGEPVAGGRGVTATWDGDAAEVITGAPLMWLTGPRADGKTSADSVAKYDPTTKQLTWSGSAEPAPAAGDKFVVGFGQTLQAGRHVYMKNCMHCHGVSGDGAGPTAKYLNPLPRDYRLGLFKFTSTLNPEKPTRDDLTRIVKYGIPGTYMPSFLWLGDKETVSVVDYVRWLAMRGEFEKRLAEDLTGDYSQKSVDAAAKKALDAYNEQIAAAQHWDERAKLAAAAGSEEKLAEFDKKHPSIKDLTEKPAKPEKAKTVNTLKNEAKAAFAEYEKEEFATLIDETATVIAGRWTQGEDPASLVVPSVARVTDDAASRERGRRIYLSDKGKCYTCHGIQGRGDGTSTEEFWKVEGTSEFYPRRGLHDAWGNPLPPRNLTLGQYRGGRRPVDVFRRIYAGIKGTPMPAFGKTALKDEEIWDVVNYVMSLQYQSAPGPAKAKSADHVATSK
jgi:mono/diheme cytochrome c family protein